MSYTDSELVDRKGGLSLFSFSQIPGPDDERRSPLGLACAECRR